MQAANRIVKYLVPAVMTAAVLAALGVAALVAEFTPADRLVEAAWIVTIVVLVVVVSAVPLLYALAGKITRQIAGAAASGTLDLSSEKTGFRRPVRAPFRVTGARREHAVIVAASFEGLTRLMEALPPEAAGEAFNTVLAACDRQVKAQGGVIERFLDREALFLFRGRPFGGDPEIAAARAVLALAAQIPELTVPGQSGRLRGLRFLAGVTSGSVMIAQLRETHAAEAPRLTVFGELATQARTALNTARNRGVNVLVTTYVEARVRGTFRLTAVGAINEMLAHQRVEVFVLDGAAPAGAVAREREATPPGAGPTTATPPPPAPKSRGSAR